MTAGASSVATHAAYHTNHLGSRPAQRCCSFAVPSMRGCKAHMQELISILALQMLPAWHSLMLARRPVGLTIPNCADVPAVSGFDANTVRACYQC